MFDCSALIRPVISIDGWICVASGRPQSQPFITAPESGSSVTWYTVAIIPSGLVNIKPDFLVFSYRSVAVLHTSCWPAHPFPRTKRSPWKPDPPVEHQRELAWEWRWYPVLSSCKKICSSRSHSRLSERTKKDHGCGRNGKKWHPIVFS